MPLRFLARVNMRPSINMDDLGIPVQAVSWNRYINLRQERKGGYLAIPSCFFGPLKLPEPVHAKELPSDKGNANLLEFDTRSQK